MASLRDTVKQYQEELRDGIAWIAFWREGRSWNGEDFYLDTGDSLTAEQKSRLEEIRQKDPAAVILNSYYCGYLAGDMTVDELTAGVRRHYENGYNDVADFIAAHDDTLSPEVLEKARALEVTSGTAKVFWISGADEAVTLLETTGTYSDTITLPDGGNYIGIECENFTGNIEMDIE